jgi:hypothetical protein
MTETLRPAGTREIPLPARVIVSLRAGVVLAIANIACVLIASWAWVHVRADPKTITVTGSAKKTLRSDLIVWTTRITAANPKLDMAYGTLKTSVSKTLAYLRDHQISPGEVKVGSIETVERHQRDEKGNPLDAITSYELAQSVEVTSASVDRVADVSRTVTDLIQDGVLLNSEPPRYLYTKLADLKIAMLAEATKDATARAEQISTNSKAQLGPIIDAKMGVIQINALHSDEVSGSGVNDTSSLDKEITAIVTARFGLR